MLGSRDDVSIDIHEAQRLFMKVIQPHISTPFRHSRKLAKVIIAAMALFALQSCATRSLREKLAGVVSFPRHWQGRTESSRPLDTASLAVWWRKFHDPVLNALIDDALQNSPDVRTALSRIDEYRARRGVEAAALFPTLSAGTTARGSRTRSAGRTVNSESYGASLDASWQVDLFGAQRQLVNAADADLSQTVEAYRGAQVSLAADVATAYVALRSAEAQLSVVQHSLGTRGETVKLTQWREQAGTGNALDTQQSISILEQARASIPALKLTISQTKNQLALLSGRTPGSLDARLSAARAVPQMSRETAIGIPADTLRQRPDVRAAERGAEAAFARTTAAERERFPSLNLSGSIGIEALKAGHIFSPESAMGSVLGGLTAPIFTAGRIRNNIAAQSARENQSVIAYESAVLAALAEVENALVAVQRNGEQRDTLRKATAAARSAATLSALQYKAGQIDLLVSLDAQRTLLSLEQQEVRVSAQQAGASIQLYKALGGGWSRL